MCSAHPANQNPPRLWGIGKAEDGGVVIGPIPAALSHRNRSQVSWLTVMKGILPFRVRRLPSRHMPVVCGCGLADHSDGFARDSHPLPLSPVP